MTDDFEKWEGLDATAVAVKIVSAQPEVTRIRLFEPPFPPTAQERLAPSVTADDIEDAFNRALKLREELEIPFWDGALLAARAHGQAPVGLLSAACYHQSAQNVQLVEREAISEETLRAMAARVSPGRMLALSSAVDMRDGSMLHIPMLDFHGLHFPEHLAVAREIIAQLAIEGVLLSSGKSFHFYGEALLPAERLIAFLARALLFAPLVDHRWVAHQLLEGASALRISSQDTSGVPPYVVARVTTHSPAPHDR